MFDAQCQSIKRFFFVKNNKLERMFRYVDAYVDGNFIVTELKERMESSPVY